MNITKQGFIRVASAVPKTKIADCKYNVSQIKILIDKAQQENIQIICFPELSITSYTCGDLFFQDIIHKNSIKSLFEIEEYLKDKNTIVIVGLPIKHEYRLYNVAAVISKDGIKGFVPKMNLPNHNEFYEKRWFTNGSCISNKYITINKKTYPISNEILFDTGYAKFGIEICEDLWMVNPPSSNLCQNGADIIFNLSASNELIGKNEYRKSLIIQQSARGICAYVYSSSGIGESSTDTVFSGSSFIAENGIMINEGKRFSFENELIINDIDINAIRNDKLKNSNYIYSKEINTIDCYLKEITVKKLFRHFNTHPFIPKIDIDNSLQEVFNIQIHGLVKRLLHTGVKNVTIGISGGLDSTLALLVTIKAFDILSISRKNIYGITMPGFGTTKRTLNNAISLMNALNITSKEISIINSVNQHFKDIEFDSNDYSITYENCQARERTQILMDYANKINGFVIGTGNLSELALGWATYNGDHMSMYAVNVSVPKTLVKSLVEWICEKYINESEKNIIKDILDTPFSPELLPNQKEKDVIQKTENIVGPYELHDFFIHKILRYNSSPSRIYFDAKQAFINIYSEEEILKWLKTFYKRFFSNQFKRSCMPDGPKVGSINLSPRADWRMPSDASVELWIEELDNLK